MVRLTFIICMVPSILVSSSAISQEVLLRLKKNNEEIETDIIKYRNKRIITKKGTFHYKEILFVRFEPADNRSDKLIKSLKSSGVQVYFDNDIPISFEPTLPVMDSTLITRFHGFQSGIPFLFGYELTTLNVNKPQRGYLGFDIASSIFLSYFSLGGAVMVDDKSQWAIGLRFMREHEFQPGTLLDFSSFAQSGPQFTIEHFRTIKNDSMLHFKLGLFISPFTIFPMLTVTFMKLPWKSGSLF